MLEALKYLPRIGGRCQWEKNMFEKLKVKKLFSNTNWSKSLDFERLSGDAAIILPIKHL